MQKDGPLDTASDIASELRAWRANALNALLIVTAIAAAPVIMFIIREAVLNPEQWPAALTFLVIYLFIAGLAVFRRLDYRLRVWGLLLLVYAAGALAFARGGLAGDGRVYLLGLPVLAMILVGLRAGLAMAALSLLTFAVFAWTAQLGWMAEWLVRRDNPLLLMDWVIGGVAFLLTLAVIMAIQWYFDRLQRTVAAKNFRLYQDSKRLRAFNEDIVQNMKEGILLEDATGRITFLNPKSAELLGYTAEELIGVHWQSLVDPEYVEKVEEETTKRPQGISSQYEVAMLTREGKRVPVIISACSLFAGERFTGVLSVLTDITERKKAEEEIKKFKIIADQGNYGIAISNLKGNIQYLNKYFAEIHGYSPQELIGKNLDIFHNKEQLERVRKINEGLIETGGYSNEEVWHTRRDGATFPMLMNGVVIKDDEGETQFLAATAIDITARKQAEQQAVRAERLAAMGQIAAALAHEVNNPLQAIRGNLELLLAFDVGPDERRERLEVSCRQIELLTKLSRRVLDFARPTDDTRYPTSIARLAERSLALMDKQLELAHIQVTTDFPTELPPVFVAPDQIVQVLLNLTINAIEAMPNGGKLRIAGHVDGDMVALALTNDGPHLPPEHIERIFDPFFTTKPNGAGLGLSVSHSIIQRHDGTIRVVNLESEQGVTFTITLPIAYVAREEMVA